MMGLGLRWSPLLVFLAVSQFAGSPRVDERMEVASLPSSPDATSPEKRGDGEDTTALPATPRRTSAALRLLLHEAAVRWHME